MHYYVKWRRNGKWFWAKEGPLKGHWYDSTQNKMVFHYTNGGIREVADWINCEIKLGTDWVAANKDQMEKEANQPVRVNVDQKKD